VDPTILSAIIGAIATIFAVVIAWWLSNRNTPKEAPALALISTKEDAAVNQKSNDEDDIAIYTQ
jgi:hypothetical protein